MNSAHKMIKDWFTGPDGETYDPARFLWFAGVVVFLVFSSIEIYRNDKFDMANFAFAYSSLLAAGAAGIKIKESTEPTQVALAPVAPTSPVAPVAPVAATVTPAPAQPNVQVTVITDDDIPKPPKA